MRRNSINSIYFSEISDKMMKENKYLTYLGFDNVDIDALVKGKNLYFLMRYQGKYGREVDVVDEDGFVSDRNDYSWVLKLVKPKVDMISNRYRNITLHIFKPFLFRGVKITLKDTEDNTVLAFRTQKSILERPFIRKST